MRMSGTHVNVGLYVRACVRSGGARGGGVGCTITGAAISSCKCISTTPIGAPIYIWTRAAIPPAPPLCVRVCFTVLNHTNIRDMFHTLAM